MTDYEAPTITPLGSVQDLTHSVIHKTRGLGDVIVIGSESISVGGGSVTGVS